MFFCPIYLVSVCIYCTPGEFIYKLLACNVCEAVYAMEPVILVIKLLIFVVYHCLVICCNWNNAYYNHTPVFLHLCYVLIDTICDSFLWIKICFRDIFVAGITTTWRILNTEVNWIPQLWSSDLQDFCPKQESECYHGAMKCTYTHNGRIEQ